MKKTTKKFGYFLGCAFWLALGESALAVPYASSVRNTMGDTWEFVLNESADAVTILRDGANDVVINSPMPGRHTFDMSGFSDFEIRVAKDTPAAWTEISDAANLHTYYFRPNGVVVNQDPSSPYFGTVYISHPIDIAAAPGLRDRDTGNGIYSLTADLIGVDLANDFAELSDPLTATAVAPPGWVIDGSTSSSPWQLTLDGAGNVIASDFSDASGGFKWATPDLVTDGGPLLRFQDGVRPLLINDNNEEVHGSIVSKPNVTGSIGNNLTLWGIDEDFDLDGDTFEDPDGAGPLPPDQFSNSLWRWDVGTATDYDQPPSLEISSEALQAGSAEFPEVKWFDQIHGVAADAHYEPQFDQWYLTQSRTHGNESSLVIVEADGVDGTMPNILWSSRDYSLDNGLDGNVPTANTPPDATFDDGLQDVFRSIGSVVISDDGTKLFAHRAEQFNDESIDGDNPLLGEGSAYPGSILVIPLDENGLPDLDLSDNGTPEDPSDDFFTNLDSITIEQQLGRHFRAPIALDAAGNVYITNNLSELLQVFSPGGNTLAITGSDGSFNLQSVGDILPGDYNNNGVVDAADYVVWRDSLGGSGLPNDPTPESVDETDYDTWVNNFGNTAAGSGLGDVAAVPEPAAMVLLMLGLIGGLVGRRGVSRR